MISQLKGMLLNKNLPFAVIDVGGVGYEVELSLTSFYALPDCGGTVVLLTHFIVREDLQYLVGFHTHEERRLFRELIRVGGIGPKVALAILSSIEPAELIRCVLEKNEARLIKLPGIGKKTAQRLLMEMHDRFISQGETLASFSGTDSTLIKQQCTVMPALQEAQQALEVLGYKSPQALTAVKAVYQEGLSSEALIRLALQGLATPK